jgi:hypothetical protein
MAAAAAAASLSVAAVDAHAHVGRILRRHRRREALQQRRFDPRIVECSSQPDRLSERLTRLSVPMPLELEGPEATQGVHPHWEICERTRHVRRLQQRLLRLFEPPQLDERAPGIAARDNRATDVTAGLTQPLAPEEEIERRDGLTEIQVAQRGEVQSVALGMRVTKLAC